MARPNPSLPLLLVALLPSVAAHAAGIVVVTRVDGGAGPARAFDLLEWRVDLARSYADPFDPAVVQVTASLDDGLDTVWQDGFWFEDYEATVTAGVERLAPVGEPHFRVRFRPQRAATWQLTVRVTDADGVAHAEPLEVVVIAPEQPARGFVRVSPTDPTRLAWSDGTPYRAWGANVCWVGYDEGTAGFARYFDALAAEGLTWTRVWMTHFDATTLEWSAGDGGAYQGVGRYNLRAAWRVDRILRLAEERGIALQLVLQQHSQFETSNWSSWAENPWNAANGGPLEASADFFTHPGVIEAFDARLTYLVARYAHSPGLLAWELWNEVELIEGARKADVEAWSRERAAHLQARDRYHHPITTSYSSPCWAGCTQPWADDAYDLTQVHSYLPDYWLALQKAAPRMRAYGKPAIVGELGIDFLGEKNRQDGEGVHLVNASLLAAMLGFQGGSMSWWWDTWLEPNGLWSRLGAVARALEAAGIGAWRAPLEGVSVRADVPLEVIAAETTFGALLWLHDPRSEWDDQPPDGADGEVRATVELTGVLDGCGGAAVYLDPWSGQALGSEPGPLPSVTPPPFRRDLLVRLEHPPAPADPSPEVRDDADAPEAPDAPGAGEAPDDPADEGGGRAGGGGCAVTSFR